MNVLVPVAFKFPVRVVAEAIGRIGDLCGYGTRQQKRQDCGNTESCRLLIMSLGWSDYRRT
ncbi:MAG TPA: hypothetical protein DCR20_01780 [Planctomycetaceae bacterium]|nr:hypothetical protein [Planctomycetaceae bacterium]